MTSRKPNGKAKPAAPAPPNADPFRLLFDNHPVPMWVYDLESLAFLEVNDAAVEKYGYSRNEFLALTLKDIRPVEDVCRLIKDVKKKRPPLQHSGEWRHRLKDGRIIDVDITSHTIELHGREAALVMAHDVTQRKRAEGQLRHQAALLATVNDAIVASDAQYRLTAWNAAAESLYGWKAEEVLGRSGLEVVRTEWPAVEAEEMRRTIAEAGRWRGEATQARKDGTRIPVEVSSIVLRDESGQITGYVSVNRDITERKRAEQEIASLAKFPSENPNPVLRLSRDGIVMYANAASGALMSMWGCAVGGSASQFWRDVAAQALASRENKTVDIECDGKVYSMFVTPVAEPGYVNLYGRDNTERKRAEEALRETKDQLETILHAIADGVTALDASGRLIYANDVVALAAGYPSAEEMLRNYDQAQSAEQYSLVDEAGAPFPATQLPNRLVLEGKPPRAVVVGYRSKPTGAVRWSDVQARPVFDPQGKVQFVVTVIHDVTERKREEEALKESEAKYRDLIEKAWDAIFVVNPQGEILLVNQQACQMLRYAQEELLRMNIAETYLAEERDVAAKRIEMAKKGEHLRYERFMVRKDGTSFPVEIAIGMLPNGSMQGIAHDITERKRTEEELKRSREQLRALAHYLQTSREQERTMIAREIHDELGQSLTALKMDLAWLTKRLPPEANALPGKAHEKAQGMMTMINDSLQLMRRIASDLRPGLLDDLGLIAAMEWQASEFTRRSEVTCELNLPQDLVLDRDRTTVIFRVFQETLTNVARHAQAKRVEVWLEADEAEVRLTVKDDGVGITADQIDDPKSLGLIGIRERIHYFNGSVSFESRDGTIVKVRLPK